MAFVSFYFRKTNETKADSYKMIMITDTEKQNLPPLTT